MKNRQKKKLLSMLLTFAIVMGLLSALTVTVGAIPFTRSFSLAGLPDMATGATATHTPEVYLNAGDFLTVTLTFTPLATLPSTPRTVEIGVVNEFNEYRAMALSMGNSGNQLVGTRVVTVQFGGAYRFRLKNNLGVPVRVTGTYTYTKSSFFWHANDPSLSPNEVAFHTGTPRFRVDSDSKFGGSFTSNFVMNTSAISLQEWETSDIATGVLLNGQGTTGAEIYIRAGTPQQIYDTWEFNLNVGGTSVANGVFYAKLNNLTHLRTRTINGASREIYRFNYSNPMYVYFANKFSSGTLVIPNEPIRSYTSRSATGHRNVIKHEIGHALGWLGHETGSFLMASSTSDAFERFVTTRHRDHITQFKRSHLLGTL